MRTLIKLVARQDMAYDNTANHKLQGAIHSRLRGYDFPQIHTDDIGLYSYSNIFPPRPADAGDSRHLLFAATDRDLTTAVAREFCKSGEVNIGDMPLQVQNAHGMDPKVGETGSLETGTPIVVRYRRDRAQDHGIDPDGEYDRIYWQPEHGTDIFFERLQNNLQYKYRKAFDENPPEPPYFSGFSMENHISTPVAYADKTVPYIASEWTFNYEVRTAKHRRLLNLCLDTGLGELNGLGYGFINREED